GTAWSGRCRTSRATRIAGRSTTPKPSPSARTSARTRSCSSATSSTRSSRTRTTSTSTSSSWARAGTGRSSAPCWGASHAVSSRSPVGPSPWFADSHLRNEPRVTERRYDMSSSGYAGRDTHDSGLAGAAAVMLGILVAVLGFFALMMWVDARHARDDANRAAASTAGSMPGMDMSSTATAGSLTRYAGAAPANADELATAHKPYSAVLPPAPAGSVADVNLKLTDLTIDIAPGVKYSAWAWAGGAPGPIIHVRQGQLVKITLTNNGAIPHSVDFHAARIAPDKAFTDVMPGQS